MEAVVCGAGVGLRNTSYCPRGYVEELVKFVERPPRGLNLYKFGSRSVVGTIELEDGSAVVLKYYYPKGLIKHLTYGIGGSRCMRSWAAALAFEYLGLPTPPAMLVFESHSLGGAWLAKSFLATGQAAGITLEQWVRQHEEDPARLESIAERMRNLFTKMGQYRISHGDLKATNILVAEDDLVSLVDLDATQFLSPLREWPKRRKRDIRIFAENWGPRSTAAKIFATVFPHS